MRTAAEESGPQDFKFSSTGWTSGRAAAAMSMSEECFNESPHKEELALLHEGRNRQSPGMVVRKAVKDGWVDVWSGQRFPEDLDFDDAVIGQTLFNAYRRRVDHSAGEGLSSSLSS